MLLLLYFTVLLLFLLLRLVSTGDVQGVLRLIHSFDKWNTVRQKTFDHFTATYPDLVAYSLPEILQIQHGKWYYIAIIVCVNSYRLGFQKARLRQYNLIIEIWLLIVVATRLLNIVIIKLTTRRNRIM